MPDTPANDAPFRVLVDCEFGEDVLVYQFTNLYGCTIGKGTRVGAFVEISSGVSVGDRCKISSHSYICDGVAIGDGVFIGHGVVFVNDKYPRAVNDDGSLQTGQDWELLATRIGDGASIGSGATILGGLTRGRGRDGRRRRGGHSRRRPGHGGGRIPGAPAGEKPPLSPWCSAGRLGVVLEERSPRGRDGSSRSGSCRARSPCIWDW